MAKQHDSPDDSWQARFLAQPMGPAGIIMFGAFFIGLSVLAAYLLISVWPGKAGQIQFFGGRIQWAADVDLRLTLVAIIAGVLGAFVHSATSFAIYLGNRQLIRSWAGWYVLRPFIGMALALIFYFLIRGGFLTPGADGSAISPYGIAAVAGLVGMFSKEATDKLQQVFKDLFKPPEDEEARRRDKLDGKT